MQNKSKASKTDASEREPYESPRIVYREPLEAVATVCQPAVPNGPAKGTALDCPSGPLSS